MEEDLHISDKQYLIALTIFFFPYALFEVSIIVVCGHVRELDNIQVPSNVFLKRLRPSVWLSFLMFAWGIMMVRQPTTIPISVSHLCV